MSRIFLKLSYNMQNKILPHIFIYVKIYKRNLLKELNSYIKYSKYNIILCKNKFRLIPGTAAIKLPPYNESFYTYFFKYNSSLKI